MNTFKIGAILERDEITPKASHQFRVGRTGTIINLKRNERMVFEYSERGILLTANVVDYQEDNCVVWVTTENSTYRLDYIPTNQI